MSKNRARGLLVNLDLILAGACFIILVAITFAGVWMRYFFGNPFVWQEEIQLWLFLWIAFFGGSAAFRSKSHIEIEMVVEMFPEKVQKIIQVFIYALVVTVLGYLVAKGCSMIEQFVNTSKSTYVLSIPSWLIYSALPIGGVLMLVNYTFVTWTEYFPKKKDPKEGEW